MDRLVKRPLKSKHDVITATTFEIGLNSEVKPDGRVAEDSN